MASFKRNIQVILNSAKGKGIYLPAEPLTAPLKISFRTKTTNAGKASTGNYVAIWNLSGSTRNAIIDMAPDIASSKLDKKKVSVGGANNITIMAGYGDNLEIAYQGVMTRIEVRKKGEDVVMHISLGNNTFNISQAIYTCSKAGKNNIKDILLEAAKTFDLPVEGNDLLDGKGQVSDFTFSGSSANLIDKYLPHDMKWFVDGNSVRFDTVGKTLGKKSVIISKSTGLVGLPVRTSTGVNITTLLNPSYTIGSLITLKQGDTVGPNFSGNYKITALEHDADNFDGDFISNLECSHIE